MPEIAFHVDVPNTVHHTARLLRKAYSLGARVWVWVLDQDLKVLSDLLWTHEASAFLPHLVVPKPSPQDKATDPWQAVMNTLSSETINPIFLCEQIPTPQWIHRIFGPQLVLINLSDQIVPNLMVFHKLIDIVGPSETQRELARDRWRYCVRAGFTPSKHQIHAA